MNKEYFKDKKIFITGAGTIGSAILKKLLEFDIDTIRIFDNCELKLHDLKQIYKNNKKVKLLLGDIRDKERLEIAMRGIDIVFHTAALKHVSFCEDNPVDAVKTNVFGTQNIIDISIKENIEKVVYISTDKAVSPINVMGATKLLGERLIITAQNYKGKSKTIFSSIRFGNIIGSSGSIIPIFEYQIKNNQPLTVTDPKAIRFMMKTEEAIDLILNTVNISRGSEIFILKMIEIKILDLAKEINKKYGRDENNIIISGIDKCEKLQEELITKEEMRFAMQNNKMYVIPPKELIDYYNSMKFTNIKLNNL
jgi:FlaA1/EpsC-like NDP-sugar epimerase